MNGQLDKLTPGLPAKLNLLIDLFLVALGMHLARSAAWFAPQVLGLLAVAVIAWVLGSAVTRLYSPCTPRNALDQVALTLLLVASESVGLWILDRLVFGDAAHPFSVLTFGGVVFVLTAASRLVLFPPLHRIAAPVDHVLIVGTGPTAMATWDHLTRKGHRRHEVIGFLRFDGDPAAPLGAPVLGRASDLLDVLQTNPVDEVYIAGRVLTHGAQMQRLVSQCEEIGVPFALPVHALQFERARLLSSSSATDGYLHYLSTGAAPMQYALKRVVDIVCSAAALVVLSPLLLVVAAAIKLTSPGPVLFRQVRVGLHGARFNLLKFRSMVVNADALKDHLLTQNEQTGPVFKMKHDPRVTAIGRFIRKYSIDELPQLVNILRGDMTIVGPRPAVPREVAQYKVWQRRRLSVRPGLTCYWQVGGRNEIGFEQWMQLDLRYVDNWSLSVDAELI